MSRLPSFSLSPTSLFTVDMLWANLAVNPDMIHGRCSYILGVCTWTRSWDKCTATFRTGQDITSLLPEMIVARTTSNMATHYSANQVREEYKSQVKHLPAASCDIESSFLFQFEGAFCSQRLQNYEVPAFHKEVRTLVAA